MRRHKRKGLQKSKFLKWEQNVVSDNHRAGPGWITITLVLFISLGQTSLAQSSTDQKKTLTLAEAVDSTHRLTESSVRGICIPERWSGPHPAGLEPCPLCRLLIQVICG